MLDKLRSLLVFYSKLNINDILFTIISRDNDIQVDILNLNRLDQLFDEGIRSDGTIIGFYSPATQARDSKKVAGTHYTLFDEGKFFDSFKLIPSNQFFEIVANPIRDNTNLFEKYGSNIVGLTEDSKSKLVQLLIPKIQDYIKFSA